MGIFFAASATVVLVAPLASQLTTPAGFLSTSGNRLAFNYGLSLVGPSYRNVRYQVTEPDVTRASVLSRMDWRTQSQGIYDSTNGQGRSFSRVTLRLGNAVGSLGKDMARNFNGSPTTVFSGKWSQLSINGRPKQVWGNAGSFPFSKAAIFLPKKGQLLQDWSHVGGKLANGYAGFSPFDLDSYYSSSSVFVYPLPVASGPNRFLPRRRGGGCVDSGITLPGRNAVAALSFRLYGRAHPTASYRGKVQLVHAFASFVAPGKPIIGMMSLSGSDAGVGIGALCNKLYVNPHAALVVITMTADTSTSGVVDFAGTGGLPTTPALSVGPGWVGSRIYWQAAWQDSKTNALSLTDASKLTMPAVPADPTRAAAFVSEYFFGSSSTKSNLGPGTSSYHRPIVRWNAK